MSKTVAYAELKAKVRTYTDKEGKEKGVYIKIGTLFASEHFNNMFITLEAMPIGKDFSGIVSVFPIEQKKTEVAPPLTDDDAPIDEISLSDILF